MPRPLTKEKITVTVDITVIDAIFKIRSSSKYANFSAVTNEILRQGSEAKGITLES